MNEENSSVLLLLPLLLENLFGYENQLVNLTKIVESCRLNVRWKIIQERLNELPPHIWLELLSIDEDKAVLLAFMLGSMFAESVDLLVSRRLVVLVYNSDCKQVEIDRYFQGQFNRKVPVILRFKPPTTTRTQGPKLVISQLQKLSDLHKEVAPQILSVIEEIRQEDELSRKPEREQQKDGDDARDADDGEDAAESTFDPSLLISCDLKSWYCSCEEFQNQTAGISSNHPEGSECGSSELFSVEKLTNGSVNEKLLKILNSPFIKTKHKSPLPICCHLLSILIISFNNLNPSTFYSIA